MRRISCEVWSCEAWSVLLAGREPVEQDLHVPGERRRRWPLVEDDLVATSQPHNTLDLLARPQSLALVGATPGYRLGRPWRPEGGARECSLVLPGTDRLHRVAEG